MKGMTVTEFEDWKLELLERVDLAVESLESQLGFIVSLMDTMPANSSAVYGEYEMLMFSIAKFRQEIEELELKK